MASPGFIPRDRLLAIAGVVVNAVGLVLGSWAIQHEDPLQTANVVLAIAAWIPTAITGLIASVACSNAGAGAWWWRLWPSACNC